MLIEYQSSPIFVPFLDSLGSSAFDGEQYCEFDHLSGKDDQIGKKSADFLRNRYSFWETIRD